MAVKFDDRRLGTKAIKSDNVRIVIGKSNSQSELLAVAQEKKKIEELLEVLADMKDDEAKKRLSPS